MISTFFGLEMAKRALQSQQLALDVTGHNISNANTQGYSRQTANLTTTPYFNLQGMSRTQQVGTGVTVEQITRSKDIFIDRQLRNETSNQQYWTTKSNALDNIQAILNEPTDNGLRDDLDKFWNAWSELAKNPESLAARTVVAASASALTESFRNISQNTIDVQQNLDNTLNIQIKQINNFAIQIKDLSDQIYRAQAVGGSPNDLMDKRDMLVDELSKMVNVKVLETNDANFPDKQVGVYSVVIGDPTVDPPYKLVDGEMGIVYPLDESDTSFGGISLSEEKGSIKAYLDVRDVYIPSFLENLDNLAKGIATAVNGLHQSGLDLNGNPGEDFFVFSAAGAEGALTIGLNTNITNDISKIAAAQASGTTGTGDGTTAQSISSLAEGWKALSDISPAEIGSATSFANFYAANVANIGVDVQQANDMETTKTAIVSQLMNQRDSVSGVSLDEEMVNLVKYQKSFAAAARVVTMMDQLLETIINGMGVTR